MFLKLTILWRSDPCLILSMFHSIVKAVTLLQSSVKRKCSTLSVKGWGLGNWLFFRYFIDEEKKQGSCTALIYSPVSTNISWCFLSRHTELRPVLRSKLAWLTPRSALSERQSGLRCKHLIVYRHSDKTHCLFLL